MQLKKKHSRIALIAGSLVGSIPVAHGQSVDWETDVTAFRYAESGGRVADNSIKIQTTRTTEREQVFSAGFSYDSLTGASAGGYVDQQGSGQPQLTGIEDTRLSANASLSQPFGEGGTTSVGGSFSNEDDYLHTGFNVSVSRELNNKNTTVSAGYAHAADTVHGVVGNPVPGSFTSSKRPEIGEQDKSVNDIVVGLTQVVDKNTIAQLNYSYSHSSGYLNDPYKVVSVVDASGRPQDYIHESRPDSRAAHGIFAAVNRQTPGGVLKPSYRLFFDDWGVVSHTVEMKYAHELSGGRIIEPRMRYYHQSRADFYRGQIGTGESLSQYLSSDYRLDEFSAITLGMQYRTFDKRNREWKLGFDFYKQSPSDNPDQRLGQDELNPGITAVIARIGVKF